ncbi:DUF3224 domain-containing protein [Lewinella sp. IMCC34183]|uniref:DUF3224 domain-containing protein n=1 Tax=Lewinella sp. IMCC34183 TaxID=2248762 RepID=UPI000E26E75B|nr:DUF3224 domain-containing protein [Lewinella sp. IMCC34183]
MKTTGTFQVKMQPLEPYAQTKSGAALGRMSLDKTFSGPLEATSRGEMLTGMATVKGSAGYVAIEKVDGSLEGKKGTFVLQHFGTMQGGNSRLIVEVVPDTATGELTGLSGTMDIRNEGGTHQYDFDYQLP